MITVCVEGSANTKYKIYAQNRAVDGSWINELAEPRIGTIGTVHERTNIVRRIIIEEVHEQPE